MDKYKISKELGRGSFGCALLAHRRADGVACVIKEVDLANMPAAERREAEKEAGLLSTLDHPNIVSFWESFVHKSRDSGRTWGGLWCCVRAFPANRRDGSDDGAMTRSPPHARCRGRRHRGSPPLTPPGTYSSGGRLCIVMEYADGGDLQELLKGRRGNPLPESQVVALFIQICLALKHIHDRKVRSSGVGAAL